MCDTLYKHAHSRKRLCWSTRRWAVLAALRLVAIAWRCPTCVPDLLPSQEVVLEHTAVGDAGVLHLARLPRLRSLTLSNFISSLGHLSFLPGGPHVR